MVAFLVAITVVRRVAELHALTSKPPNAIFLKDKGYLHPHRRFISKVVSDFHNNHSIYLPVCYPKPHANKEKQYLNTIDV